jgi:hypothetical protein
MGKKKVAPQESPMFKATRFGDLEEVQAILKEFPTQLHAKNNVS